MKYLLKLPVFVRYALSTIINTSVNVGTYCLLLALGVPVIAANIISIIVEIPVSYILKDKFVFINESKNNLQKFGKFLLSRLFATVLELVLVPLFSLIIDEVVSKIIGQICVFITNFFVSKLFVFK